VGGVISTCDPALVSGEWSIDRDLADLRAGRTGRFVGTLHVDADGAGYSWREQGELTWGEYTGTAGRLLRLARHEGQWWMCFADGGLFHPWRPGAEVVHPCAADLYRGTVAIEGPDPARFEITWDVTGPAKRQRIVSRMRRSGR
jgi:hypothetical protein